MNNSNEMIKLYSGRILELAGNIPLTDPLPNADGVANRRSPLCGSNITVSINFDGNHITAFSHDVKACALGQASASIFAKHVVGLNRQTIETGRDQLFEMLANKGPHPLPPFDELSILEPAREYKNRHASILLAFNATLDAIDEIIEKKRATKAR